MFSYVPLCLVCVCVFPFMAVLLDSYGDREDRGCILVYKGSNPHLSVLAPLLTLCQAWTQCPLAMVMFAGWL